MGCSVAPASPYKNQVRIGLFVLQVEDMQEHRSELTTSIGQCQLGYKMDLWHPPFPFHKIRGVETNMGYLHKISMEGFSGLTDTSYNN